MPSVDMPAGMAAKHTYELLRQLSIHCWGRCEASNSMSCSKIQCHSLPADRDFFMSAQEAVEYGLVDAVISKPALLAASAQNGA